MRAFVRSSALAASLSLLAGAAAASTNGVFLPAAPSGTGGEDSIETSSGTRCRQSINSNGTYLDVGITGTAASPTDRDRGILYTDGRDREATAYARVTIPLGRRPERIDCSAVYRLEIEKLKREVELLRMGAK